MIADWPDPAALRLPGTASGLCQPTWCPDRGLPRPHAGHRRPARGRL